MPSERRYYDDSYTTRFSGEVLASSTAGFPACSPTATTSPLKRVV